MAYKFDKIYTSNNGTVLSNPAHAVSLTGATNMEYDGRYLWVTCTGGIAIFEWWGAASHNEPAWDTLDALMYPRYDSGANKKLRLVTFITIDAGAVNRTTALESMKEVGSTAQLNGSVWTKSTARSGTALSPYWIKKCADKMYVTSGATFTRVFEFNIQTQNLIREIAISANTMSNLGVSGTKLWYVGSSFTDTTIQKMYCYNPQTSVTTFADIPVRPSMARSWIASGFNGSVYVTNYNNVSVSRFSDIDGTLQATIRVNAEPTHIFSGPDRRIWVSSYGGMLSLIDYDDDGVHNDYSTGIGEANRAQSLFVDPTDGSKIWFINTDNVLVRQDLNTKQQLELMHESVDLTIIGDTLTIPQSSDVLVKLDNEGSTDLEITDPDGNRITILPGGSSNAFPSSENGDQIITVISGDATPVTIVPDWKIENTVLKNPDNMYISQTMYFQDADLVTHQLKPYMFLIQDDVLYALKLDNYLYRNVFATVNGQAAVAMGPQDYFGD